MSIQAVKKKLESAAPNITQILVSRVELQAAIDQASKIEAELAALRRALCLRGENPATVTPQKAREFMQAVYDALDALQAAMN